LDSGILELLRELSSFARQVTPPETGSCPPLEKFAVFFPRQVMAAVLCGRTSIPDWIYWIPLVGKKRHWA
ncbi:MAG: hypothetical protein SV239_04855, partial [Thermodesulfobacteriota bacterium]|nr:hypothetical protein [Thermodesulfobacteriota bacterium]